MGLLGKLMGAKGASNSDLVAKIKAGALIVDVRNPGEFKDGHHSRAINIPVNLVESRMNEFGPKDQAIIVYCAAGARSAMAARMLKAAGYTNVTNGGGVNDVPEV